MVESVDSARFQEVIKGNCLVVLGSLWCKDCVRIEPFLQDLSEKYADIMKTYKIDTRKEEELSAELNIRAIPTLIFYRNGIEVGKRLVEPATKQSIEEEIKENFGKNEES